MEVVVLAGGAGSRMGGPKANLEVDGLLLWEWVAGRLAAEGADVTVSVGTLGFATSRFRSVADAAPGLGPLGGIAAAHAASPSTDWIVWTVDVPAPLPGDLDVLASGGSEPTPSATDHRPNRRGAANSEVRCLVDVDGVVQPLLARWPAVVAGGVGDFLAAGGRSVTSYLSSYPVVGVGPPADRRHLTTPLDVQRWLASGGGSTR